MTISRLLRIGRHRIRSVFEKDAVDTELRQEIVFHFEQLVDEFKANGLSAEEAARAARRAFGNVALLEDQARDHRRVVWLRDIWQDLVFGARMLRKNLVFTTIAVASLALGVGANAAVLGAMSDLFSGGLPFPDGDRLVMIRTFALENPQRTFNSSVPEYFTWKSMSRTFQSVGASIPEQKDLGADADGKSAERLGGLGVTPSVFDVLGVRPALGRVFTEAEATVGDPAPVIVISYDTFQRRFGGDPNVVNTRVRLGGVMTTIIGVMPPSFRYPTENIQYWSPLALNPLQRTARVFLVAARLGPGFSLEQAQAELNTIAAQAGREFPERAGWSARIVNMHDALLGWTVQPLLMFEGAVLLVLLIACANVGGLLLARSTVRRSEMAVRMALGAGRGRIVRQLLTEAALLSVIGGVLGVLVAWWSVRGILAMAPPPGGIRIRDITLSPTMLASTAVLSLLAGLVFGLAPVLATFRLNLTASLNESVRGTGEQSGGHAVRGVLVTLQIALALALLTGTGLLMKSVVRLTARELNFDPQGILSFEVRLPGGRPADTLGNDRGVRFNQTHPSSLFMERLLQRLSTVPGAESVAGISYAPVNSLLVPSLTVLPEGRPEPFTDAQRAAAAAKYFLVTPDFLSTMRARVVRGRQIDRRDTVSSPWVAVINETAARRFWAGEDPVGKRFTFDVAAGERPREIVGIIRDIPLRSAFIDDDAVIYASYLQQSPDYRGPFAGMFDQMTFLMRSSGDPFALLQGARLAVAEIDADRAIARPMLLEWYIVGGWRDRGTATIVIGTFAGAAVLLAAIGIYGVMAYAVAQRTREIGIHMALGARAHQVIALVGRNALRVIGIGLVLGLAGSLAFSRLITAQLWGVTPTDPATYLAVSVLLAIVALAACAVPLWRAVRVDPTIALRYE